MNKGQVAGSAISQKADLEVLENRIGLEKAAARA
jgi:hypothetical protein